MTRQRNALQLIENVIGEQDAKLSTHEEEDLKNKRLENNLKAEKLLGINQDRKERKRFANKLYWFLVCFISCVIILLFLCGFGCLNFILTDSVLIALLTTTSANVIGIFIFVVKYLFYRQSN
jgi:hypothetical protein